MGFIGSTSMKIMALQLRAWRHRLYIEVPGRFAQKGSRAAEAVSRVIRQQAEDAIASLGWQLVPRARVAVEMRFFAEHGDIPDVHNLVKFYLDPLRGVAFTDDQQVACLTAMSWKPPRGFRDHICRDRNTVFIQVERFSDYVCLFDLWHALHDYPKFRDMNEDDDDRYRSSPDDPMLNERLLEARGVPEDVRAAWRRLKLAQYQNGALAGNRIDWWDRPGGAPRYLQQLGFLWKRQAHPLLFSLDLQGLPRQGESGAFRQHVRDRMHAVAEEWGDQGRFIIPLELDVQVPEGRGGIQTDLDNVIRRYIAPALAEEVLQAPDGYLHGYRIYRVRPAAAQDGTISVKMLAHGAIRRFEEQMERTLGAGREWLRKSL